MIAPRLLDAGCLNQPSSYKASMTVVISSREWNARHRQAGAWKRHGADSKNLALPPDRLGTGRFVAENRGWHKKSEGLSTHLVSCRSPVGASRDRRVVDACHAKEQGLTTLISHE